MWSTLASPDSKRATFLIVQHQLEVLTRHLSEPHGPTAHQRLCALVADLFQLAGEIFFDCNQYTEAACCYSSAARASKEASAFDLWACAIARHAFIAIYERRFRGALPMLELAGRIANRGDGALSTRYWVDAVRANALAGLGDVCAFERAIARAEGVRVLRGPVHNGGWLRFDSSRLSEERGACHAALLQPDQAEAALISALNQGLSARRCGIVLTDLAMVGVQRRDLSQLSTYASAAVDVARTTGSGVVSRRLELLRPHLRPLVGNADVRRIHEQISNMTIGHA